MGKRTSSIESLKDDGMFILKKTNGGHFFLESSGNNVGRISNHDTNSENKNNMIMLLAEKKGRKRENEDQLSLKEKVARLHKVTHHKSEENMCHIYKKGGKDTPK